jgi:hypothetical protein
MPVTGAESCTTALSWPLESYLAHLGAEPLTEYGAGIRDQLEAAMRAEMLPLLGVLDAVCGSIGQLATALVEAFAKHPDCDIATRFPRRWPTSPARSSSPRSAMTAAVSSATGRCRLSPDPRRSREPWQVPHRHPATDEEQPARRGRLLVGVQRGSMVLTGPDQHLTTAPLPADAGS